MKEQVLMNRLKKVVERSNDSSLTGKFLLSERIAAEVLKTVGVVFLYNLCIVHFTKICTYQNTDETNNFYALPVTLDIAKKMVNRYLFILHRKEQNNEKRSVWYDKLDTNTKDIIEDDDFLTRLGARLIDVLENCEMLSQKTITISKTNKQRILVVDDKLINKKTVMNLPLKLPMIVQPKPYKKDELGGYLLNDVRYTEKLIIKKKIYKEETKIDNNNFYSMINKIISTPFKINTELLEYILNNKDKHNLLLDPDVKHKFEDVENKTKYQKSQVASYNSKIVSCNIILLFSEDNLDCWYLFLISNTSNLSGLLISINNFSLLLVK